MDKLVFINTIMFTLSVSCMFLIFFFTPILVLFVTLIRGKKPVRISEIHPSISFITVVHNSGGFIKKKLQNTLTLDFPSKDYEIVVFSDGSGDNTANEVKHFADAHQHIHFLSSLTHEGKHNGINQAVKSSGGDILVFSDVDTLLDTHAIKSLIRHFADPEIGGVCGRIVIAGDDKKLRQAHADYTNFTVFIKDLESRVGSISSNDGSLYAIRRGLFCPVPPAVTDDLFACMSVIKQGYRFVFEPDALAYNTFSSRKPEHEIRRRRRIVARSLRGIYLMKEVLNPMKYGIFSINLFMNKILRRKLPILLMTAFFSSLFLAFHEPLFMIVFFFQLLFYLLALSNWVFLLRISGCKHIRRFSSLAYYFCIGNYGTLLGLFDFIRGKQIIKWNPVKEDGR